MQKKCTTTFVYILLCNDNTLYTGWTTNMKRRLSEHNAGKGSRYTRTRTPVIVVFTEEHMNKSSAMKRESSIKNLSRSKKLQLIESHQNIFC